MVTLYCIGEGALSPFFHGMRPAAPPNSEKFSLLGDRTPYFGSNGGRSERSRSAEPSSTASLRLPLWNRVHRPQLPQVTRRPRLPLGAPVPQCTSALRYFLGCNARLTPPWAPRANCTVAVMARHRMERRGRNPLARSRLHDGVRRWQWRCKCFLPVENCRIWQC